MAAPAALSGTRSARYGSRAIQASSLPQAEPDCTFVYYKDFLEVTPLTPDAKEFTAPGGQVLFTHPPPFAVSCLGPHKWRNRECPIGPEAEMGTELDWMAFFYNLNSVGDATLLSPMSDIFRIHKHACVPAPPAGTPPPADPPLCAGNYTAGWTSLPASLPLVSLGGLSSVSIPCTTDGDCSALMAPSDPSTGQPLPYTCRDDQPADSLLPCAAGGTALGQSTVALPVRVRKRRVPVHRASVSASPARSSDGIVATIRATGAVLTIANFR